jgi:hypothetical protein
MNVNACTNQLLLSQPDLSEKELQERIDGYIALCWRKETPEGRKFEKFYSSQKNIAKLSECFSLLDETVSFETLSGAFKKLVESGAIRTEQEIQEAKEQAERERDEANRLCWEQSCSEFVETYSTADVKLRAQKDPAFRAFLKAANRPPQVPVEYSEESLKRQRIAEQIQKQRDRQYADVPNELWLFADQYKKLPAAEALKRMKTELPFKTAVEACAKASLI